MPINQIYKRNIETIEKPTPANAAAHDWLQCLSRIHGSVGILQLLKNNKNHFQGDSGEISHPLYSMAMSWFLKLRDGVGG